MPQSVYIKRHRQNLIKHGVYLKGQATKQKYFLFTTGKKVLEEPL